MKRIILLVLIVLIIFDFPCFNDYAQGDFKIKKGENIFQVASNLKKQGHIKSKSVFLMQSLKGNKFKRLKAGTYFLDKEASSSDILETFVLGAESKKIITIIPGYTLNEISRLADDREKFIEKYLYLKEEDDALLKEKYSFLKDKPVFVGLEGYLYPDTYEVLLDEAIVYQALSNFDEKLTDDLRVEIEKQERTIFDVIILASIIEKEVIDYEDKEIVSGILLKRLKHNMLLEVDSTALYPFSQNYDTYIVSGFPPSPICNPSISSIKAAIYPKETDYFFYLSAKNGETIFSRNFNEHIINKFKYLEL